MSVQAKKKNSFEENKVKEDPFGKITSSEKDQFINEYYHKLGVDIGKNSKVNEYSSKYRGRRF